MGTDKAIGRNGGWRRMKAYDETDLFLDCRKLLDEILDAVPSFPKSEKSVGVEMKMSAFHLLRDYTAAYNNKAGRLQRLSDFKDTFDYLQILVRVAGERHWIVGLSRHARIIELMDKIGGKSTAWKHSLTRVSEPASGGYD